MLFDTSNEPDKTAEVNALELQGKLEGRLFS